MAAFDVHRIRQEFPFLAEKGFSVYLDNAATTQKPQAVLNAERAFYEQSYGNVHRGVHAAAEAATTAYEGARVTVQKFLNAAYSDEIIFTKNCTESINLFAHAWGRTHVKDGDAVLLSELEHHSNIVPWLQLKEEKKIDVRWLPFAATLNDLKTELNRGDVKLVSLTGFSNVLGTALDSKSAAALAHDAGALFFLDAAQLAAHAPIDVREIGCDALAFSGHKVYGPTGIGVLYLRRALAQSLPPFLGGGSMIHSVTKEGFTPAESPAKFEAGTPPIAQAVGLAAALTWFSQWNREEKQAHEDALIAHAKETLGAIHGLHPLWTDASKAVLSFTIDNIHTHDLTDALGKQGIALRAGHHCAQPLHKALGVNASTRLSVALYNTVEEIDAVYEAIENEARTSQFAIRNSQFA